MTITVPEYSDVQAAALRIAPWAVRTPLHESPELSARVGATVLLKLETLQRTGSFKFRGALNAILEIPERVRPNGVVAFSSGNHAQGVAAAAGLFGIPATIVMPSDAPAPKIAGPRRYGAKVVFYDRAKDDRESIARQIVERAGATMIEPFDNAMVVAGQGTTGLEIVSDTGARGLTLDAVLAPCGGGGLTTGVALALSGASPQTRMIAVEPQRFDGMGMSLVAGERKPAQGGPPSIADSLMAPMPGKIPFTLAQKLSVSAVAVSDDELRIAVSYAAQRLKLVVEPGGVAALAALLARRIDLKNKVIAIVLTGANCDVATIADCCRAVANP